MTDAKNIALINENDSYNVLIFAALAPFGNPCDYMQVIAVVIVKRRAPTECGSLKLTPDFPVAKVHDEIVQVFRGPLLNPRNL